MSRIDRCSGGPIRVLIADRSPSGQRRLREALGWMEGVLPVGLATTAAGAIRQAGRRRPAVIVIRASLARPAFLRAARRIRTRHPEIQFIAVTRDVPKEFLRVARRHGVHLCAPRTTLEIRLPLLVRLAYHGYRESLRSARRRRSRTRS